MKTKDDKENFMSKLWMLKNARKRFGNISITNDYTLEERNFIKKWVEEAVFWGISMSDPSRPWGVFTHRCHPDTGYITFEDSHDPRDITTIFMPDPGTSRGGDGQRKN